MEIPHGSADRIFEVEYSMPYLPHSAMEPLNCVITPDGDGVRVLNGEQFQTVDQTAVEGAANLPYAISNILTDPHSPELPVPVQWWRSVGSTHTAFAVECPIR